MRSFFVIPLAFALTLGVLPLGQGAVAGSVVLQGPANPDPQRCETKLQLSLYGQDSWMGHATLPAGEAHDLSIPDQAYPVEIQASVRTACEAFVYSTPLRCKPLMAQDIALNLEERCRR